MTPIDVAMQVLDSLGDPDSEDTAEARTDAWVEVRAYVLHLEALIAERDRRFDELVQRLTSGAQGK